MGSVSQGGKNGRGSDIGSARKKQAEAEGGTAIVAEDRVSD